MKFPQQLRSMSRQEILMAIAIAMLIICIATRWRYVTRTAGEAFRDRFIPPSEHIDDANSDDTQSANQ